MDETFMLILLVFVMLVGSYLAGSIPLVVSLSEEKLKVVTVFGAGLLVGTALTVIIPEGIRALYSDLIHKSHQSVHNGHLAAGSGGTSPKTINGIIDQTSSADESIEHSSTIGLSLVLGFVFMMLVDQISTRRNASNSSSIDGVSESDRNPPTATIGLVVHAAADGIALGAAATTSHQDVEMIVFLAIMLHKAPAAFGLVSFLLHEGIDRKRIRKHLAIFSIAAPLLTLLTYFGIGQEQKDALNYFNATGIAMLFSAGTFLYVATVHVLPELTTGHNGQQYNHHHHHHHHSQHHRYSQLEQNSSGIGGVQQAAKGYNGLRNIELAILITGALLPLLLTMGHHH